MKKLFLLFTSLLILASCQPVAVSSLNYNNNGTYVHNDGGQPPEETTIKPVDWTTKEQLTGEQLVLSNETKLIYQQVIEIDTLQNGWKSDSMDVDLLIDCSLFVKHQTGDIIPIQDLRYEHQKFKYSGSNHQKAYLFIKYVKS